MMAVRNNPNANSPPPKGGKVSEGGHEELQGDAPIAPGRTHA